MLLLTISLPLRLFSQAALQIDEPKLNFGDVQRGTVLTHTFTIRSVGSEPVIIKEAEVACSCTKVDFPDFPLLPGEKDEVVVTFNTKTVYGRQDRIVLLHSNAKGTPDKIRFKANVSKQ